MSDYFKNRPQYKPERRGDFEIDYFTVTQETAMMDNLRSAFDGSGWLFVYPGEYVRLFGHNGHGGLWMSDTRMEYITNMEIISAATGDVLLFGLGLGLIVAEILPNLDVTTLTVVELSQDLIDMISPYFDDPRLEIVQGDAWTWEPPPGYRYDTIHFDIWNTISTDNLAEMSKLKKRARKWYRKGCYCRCWTEDLLRRLRARDRRNGYY
jgi:hypothetical protein